MVSNSNDLQTARQTCARLGFLADSDLTKILAGGQDFAQSASLIFDCTHSFDIKDNKIHGIKAKTQDETLNFDTPISVEGIPETINLVIEEQKKAVRREIEGAMKINSNVMELLNSDFINQAVEIADLVNNTELIEKACSEVTTKLEGETKPRGVAALEEILEVFNQKLEALSSETLKEVSQGKRTRLNVFIVNNIELRNFIRDIMIKQVEACGINQARQELDKHLRYFWQDGVQVKIDAYEINYGYEYLGVHERLAVTDLSRYAFIQYARAIFQGQGISCEGVAGTGKTETAKDFYRHVGAYIIVINCSDQQDSDFMRQLISYVDRSGAFLCMDEYNRLPIKVITDMIPMFKEKLLKHQNGLAVTSNPGYAGRTAKPLEFYRDFSRLSFFIPDYSVICSLQLYTKGFGSASDKLAIQMHTTIQALKKTTSAQSHYDFGLRAYHGILTAAGNLSRQKTDPTEAMVSAIHSMIYSSLVKEDIECFMNIMEANFPGVKVSSRSEEFEAKFKSAHSDASETIVEKAGQIYAKSQVRHGMCILGKDEKIIQDVVQCMGGSSSVFNATNDEAGIEEFYEETLRAEFAKAEASQNHWIILKECADCKWYLFFEAMNSVTDNNKLYRTPKTNQVVRLPDSCRIVVLSQSAETMAPAMVSRLGVINLL